MGKSQSRQRADFRLFPLLKLVRFIDNTKPKPMPKKGYTKKFAVGFPFPHSQRSPT